MSRIVNVTHIFGMLGLTCLVLAAAAVPATAQQNYTWNGGSAGTWSSGGSGWLNGTSSVSWSNTTSTNAIFTGTAPTNVTVGAVTAYGLQFTAGNYVLSGGTITLANPSSVGGGTTGIISVGSSSSDTINSVIGGGLGLTLTGGGTLTLAGANSYGGATAVDSGTLVLSFGTVSANILASASTLTLGGGTLQLTGTGTQAVLNLTTTADTVSNILVGANETLTLGALQSAGANSSLNFNTAAGGANAATSTVGTGIIVLTGRTAGTPINYGYTVTDAGGFGLATVNASNQVIRLTTTALLPATGAVGTDYRIDNNAGGASAAGSRTLTVSASESTSSITVDTTAAAGVLTLNSGVVLGNTTWIFGGTGANTYQVTGSAGGAGLKALVSGSAITINNYNIGAVTISSPILASGSNLVSVFGTGTLILAGANTYTGGTTVSGGTLEVPGGGSITHTSANMIVGNNSGDNGTLSIAGGTVSNYYGYLGYNTGSAGMATVSSGTWSNSYYLYVGNSGAGALNISGGAVSSFQAYLGYNTGSNGAATVSSGAWTSNGLFLVGVSGTALLSVSGGTVSGLEGYLGYNAGSRGTATVSSGTWINGESLTVGYYGVGVLNLTNAGVVTVGFGGSGAVYVGLEAGSGTLNLGTGGAAGTLQAGMVLGGPATAVVNFNHTGGYTFAPVLAGSLVVNQLGAGMTILTAANFYTGATTVSAGQLIAANASALNPATGGAVRVAAGAGLAYAAIADAPLGLSSTLAITGGAGTVIGGSIGSTAISAEINVTGAATISNAAHAVNIYGIAGVMPLAGANTYTLLQGGPGSALNPATAAALGTVFNNTNFTVGAITATASTLQVVVTSATALTGAYWVGGLSGVPNVWAASNGSTASNWAATPGGAVQGLVPGPGASVTISAASPIAAPTATVLGANMSIAGLTIADTVNGLGLNADGFALTVGAGGITVNAGVPASVIAANVVLGASQVWTNNSANVLTVSGIVSGSAANALTITGSGVLILSGANTYTGATIVSNGALTAGAVSLAGLSGAFGNNSAVTMANVAGATLNLAGFNTQIGSLTGGGTTGGNITLGSATLTVGGDNTNPPAYAGTLSGAGGALTKIGAGTLTLAGANTYTGATTINSGTLALSFGAVAANILPGISPLTLGGGTLQVTGTGTQTVNGLTISASTSNFIQLGANETLTLGALTSAGAGSTLNFNTAAGGANAATSTVGTGIIVLTGQTAGTPIKYGFTVTDAGGFGLATVNTSNQVLRLTTTALLPATGATSANDYRIDNNAGGASAAGSHALTVSASESAKSITVDTTAASGVLTLNSNVMLSNNTWNFGGTNSNTFQVTGSAGTAGLTAVSSGNAITINNYNTSAVTISSPILANGNNLVSVFGTGTLIFAGANTYSGGTTVSGGTLQIPSGGSVTHTSASMIVGNNSGDNGTLSITGGVVSSLYGYLGNNAGSSGTATVSSGTWTNSNTLYVGNSGVGVLNVAGGSVSDLSGSGLGYNPGSNGTATISSGSWTNNNLLYVGNYGVGVLNVTGGAVSSPSGSYLGYNAGSNGTATVSSGTWTNGGNLTIGYSGVGVLNVIGAGVVTVGATGAGTLIVGVSAGSNGTLNLGIGGAAGTLDAGGVVVEGGAAVVNFNQTGGYVFAPVLAGSLVLNKLGAGTTILTATNHYTGATTVSAGQLLAANAAALNPVAGGAVTVAAGAGLGYAAVTDAPLVLHSTLAITGSAGTLIGGSIGSTGTSAEINVTGAATISNAAYAVNIYGIAGITPLAGTNTYTLLQGGPGSALNPATTATLGTVYNNSNFTVGAVSATASTLQVAVTSATPLTSAYWMGGLSGAANVWAASDGTSVSNWAATVGGAVQALVPGPGASVTISAASPITAPAATVLGANMSIAALTIADNVNGLGLNADGFALRVGAGGITINVGVPASSIAANVVLGAGQAWTNNSANALTVSGIVSGPAGNSLTKAGPGALILSGLNTYIGATTVNNGVLTAGVASMSGIGGAFGINSAITMANVVGATLNLAGFNTQIGSLTGGGTTGGNTILGAATLTVGGDNTSPAAYAGVISGAGGALTKIGAGTLILTGANTYTGATTINSGTIALSFGTVSANILSTASTLTLGGGTLSLAGTGAQTVNGLTTTADTVNNIMLGANQTLTLGALTSTGANSSLNFNTAAGGANGPTVGTGIIVLTGQAAGNPINYGFTVTDAGGFGLATVNASNQVIRLTTTALLPATGASSGIEYRIDNNAGGASAAGSSALTVSASESAKSVTVDTTAASGVLTLNSGVVLSSNTLIFGGTGANTYQIAGSAGGAGLKPGASGNILTINNYNTGAVTINSPILDSNSTQVYVFGTGTLILAGANTYNGNTVVSGGTLQVSSGGSITLTSGWSMVIGNNSGDNGTLNLTGGTVSSTNGEVGSSTGSSGTATVSSGSWTNNDLYVGVSGAGVLNVTGGTVSSSAAFLGSNTGSSGMAMVSSGNWTNSSLYVGLSGAGVLTITGGAVSSGYGTLGNNAGASGTATVSGGTWTNSGSLIVGDSGAGVLNITGTGVVIVGVTGTGGVEIGYAAGGNGTLNLGTGGAAGTLQAGGVIGGPGAAVVNFNQTGSYTFAPQLAGSLAVNKLGAGTTILTGTNTYTGPTTISAGILAINSNQTAATGLVTVGSGAQLQGTGTVGGAVVVNRGGTIRGDVLGGTGTLNLNANVTIAAGATIAVDLGNTAGGSNSQIVLGSSTTLSLNSVPGTRPFAIQLVNDGGLTVGTPYLITIATAPAITLNGGSTLGGNATIASSNYILESSTFNNLGAYSLGTDNTGTRLQIAFTPTPEPEHVLLLCAAALLLGLAIRRRWQSSAVGIEEATI